MRRGKSSIKSASKGFDTRFEGSSVAQQQMHSSRNNSVINDGESVTTKEARKTAWSNFYARNKTDNKVVATLSEAMQRPGV